MIQMMKLFGPKTFNSLPSLLVLNSVSPVIMPLRSALTKTQGVRSAWHISVAGQVSLRPAHESHGHAPVHTVAQAASVIASAPMQITFFHFTPLVIE